MYLCVLYIYIYMYTHTHTCMHTYIHTYTHYATYADCNHTNTLCIHIYIYIYKITWYNRTTDSDRKNNKKQNILWLIFFFLVHRITREGHSVYFWWKMVTVRNENSFLFLNIFLKHFSHNFCLDKLGDRS